MNAVPQLLLLFHAQENTIWMTENKEEFLSGAVHLFKHLQINFASAQYEKFLIWITSSSTPIHGGHLCTATRFPIIRSNADLFEQVWITSFHEKESKKRPTTQRHYTSSRFTIIITIAIINQRAITIQCK